MDDRTILEQIRSFPRWHYEFDIRGHKTPIFDAGHVNRHKQREAYFFRPLVQLCGGSLRGKQVLDLGCNAGFWSLKAVEAGCDHVLGIDSREMHIAQASFVFEAYEVPPERYSFRLGNVFDVLTKEIARFDIVLCLGLFYHISKHVSLLEAISHLNTDLLVIDTSLSPLDGSLLQIVHEPLDEPRNASDYELVMLPTRRAVIEMAQMFGYQCVELEPRFTDYSGADDFRTGRRRAYICSKATTLAPLTQPPAIADLVAPAERSADRTGSPSSPASGQLPRDAHRVLTHRANDDHLRMRVV